MDIAGEARLWTGWKHWLTQKGIEMTSYVKLKKKLFCIIQDSKFLVTSPKRIQKQSSEEQENSLEILKNLKPLKSIYCLTCGHQETIGTSINQFQLACESCSSCSVRIISHRRAVGT